MKNFIILLLIVPIISFGQCLQQSSYGSATAPTSGLNTITTCQYLSEYSLITSVDSGSVYTRNYWS